ncbi:hypothetical protein Tco_0811743 [Tanacetum coccineum]
MSYSSLVSKGFQPKFTPKLIHSSQYAQSSQGEPKVQKDYLAEYKKMKAKLELLEAYDDELSMGKNHACNGEWINITMKKSRDDILALKQAKLEAITFQIQNTELIKLNHAIQDQLKEERKVNEKWLNSSNKVSQCIGKQIPNQKKKILRGEQLTETSSLNEVKENPFIPASLDYDHKMVPKSKDWVERLNHDSKLLNFNTRRILVPEIQAVNECLQLTKASANLETLKESGSKPQTSLPLLKTP